MNIPRDAALTNSEIQSIKSMFHKTISQAKQILKRAQKNIEDAEYEFELYEDRSPDDTSDPTSKTETPIAEISERTTNLLRKTVIDLYHSITETKPIDSVIDRYVCEEGSGIKEDFSDMGVEVYLDEEAIFVRTPMLWSRFKKRGSNDYHHPILFADELMDLIPKAENFYTYDLMQYKKKIAHFLFVYRPDASQAACADNDNHETKHLMDAVASYLPGGDSPFSCSMFYSAALSSEVPEGTYLTITREKVGILDDKKILQFWKEADQKRKAKEG